MSDVFEKVSGIITEASGIPAEEISPTSTLAELGFDSLTTIQVAVMVENAYGVRMDREQIEALHTVADIMEYAASASD